MNRKGYYEGDEWKPEGHEEFDELPLQEHKPFDRALWLTEEMGFVFVYHLGAFVNFDIEKKHGDPANPHHRIGMDLMEAKITTPVFQRAVKIHVERARNKA